MMALIIRCNVKILEEEEFVGHTHLLRSLMDLDTPDEYAAVLAG